MQFLKADVGIEGSQAGFEGGWVGGWGASDNFTNLPNIPQHHHTDNS